MRLFFPLSGDDIFISYSRQDGSLYAAGLADELTKKKLSCFIDKLGTEPNADLPESLKKKIRSCTIFVLVGTEKAAQSKFVEKEIIEFKKTGRTFLPVDFDGNVGKAVWYHQIPGLSAEPEKNPEALEIGDPSENVVNFIEKSFGYTRRNQHMFRMFVGALTFFFILLASGVGSFLFAWNQAVAAQKEAEAQTQRAELARTEAETQTKRAEEATILADQKDKLAQQKTSEANAAQKLADEKTKLAEQKNQEAIKANNLAQEKIQLAQDAEKRQKIAETKAALQERIAFSREQASNSIALLPFDPEQSLLLAGRAYETEKTPQAEFALRRSIFDSHIKTILKGHQAKVSDAHFDESGRLAVTTGDDGTVRIWDAQSGEEIKKLGNKGNFTQVALSPNGRYVAAADYSTVGGGVEFWDLEDETKNYRLALPAEYCLNPENEFSYCSVYAVSFSADNQYIAAAGGSRRAIAVWKTDSRNLEATVLTGEHWTSRIKFSPDGKYILGNGRQAVLWEWKAAQTSSNPRFFKALDNVETAAFDPTGKFFVVAANEVLGDGTYSGQADGEAWIWSIEKLTEQPLKRLQGHSAILNDAQFSPDGNFIVTSSDDETARVWNWKDRDSEQKQIILRGHTEPVRNADFSPDGEYVVTSSDDGTARIWKPNIISIAEQNYKILIDIPSLVTLRGHIDTIWRAEFSPDGKSVITASEDGTARIWNANVETVLREFSRIGSASFSTDNKYIATADDGKPVQIWGDWQDPTVSDPIAELKMGNGGEFANPVFSNDGNFVAAIKNGSYSTDSVAIWNWRSESERQKPLILPAKNINGISFSSDAESRYLLTANGNDNRYDSTVSEDYVVRVWDWRQEKSANNPIELKFTDPRGQKGGVKDAVFSKDNKFIVASKDSVICVWEWQSETKRNDPIVLEGYTRGSVRKVDISADGKYIAATVGDGKFVDIWDWQSENGRKNPVKLKYKSNFEISDLSFVPESHILLTSSGDGTISLWDAGTGLYISTVGSYKSTNSRFRKVSFSKDGKYILVSGIQIVVADPYEIINAAKVFYCDLCSDAASIFTLIPKYVSPQAYRNDKEEFVR